ncbi:MAG: methyltransferase, partial [Methanoregulaceae archaeon]|nr:methyltransferase [Methanoregulaceae archaeon]
MRLNELERLLEGVEGFSQPSPRLEQYPTPAPLAARLLYHASLRGDITGRHVCDLGSGAGILSIGAAILGAGKVTGVEADHHALAVARRNAVKFEESISFISGDVADPDLLEGIGTCDTVLMNPPFGAQKAHADRPFIDASLVLAPVTYGIFNAGSRHFLERYLDGRAVVEEVIGGLLPIRRTFSFHR